MEVLFVLITFAQTQTPNHSSPMWQPQKRETDSALPPRA